MTHSKNPHRSDLTLCGIPLTKDTETLPLNVRDPYQTEEFCTCKDCKKVLNEFIDFDDTLKYLKIEQINSIVPRRNLC